ncbi:MAG TPA: hypothetical protein VGQ20_15905, partial [Acidimicrobiales bacterium]|nr:hypothetical protein [Acidimicrobiales bacterium]
VVVHHFGEASFGALVDSGVYGQIFTSNRRRFEAKWQREWTGHRTRETAEYDQVVSAVRSCIVSAVPEGETVLVVSKGDDELLTVPGRVAWHFPRGDDGGYAGWYPSSIDELHEQLAAQRRAGARFLVFPPTAAWWFDFYGGLGELLGREFEELPTGRGCRVFVAREPAFAGRKGP